MDLRLRGLELSKETDDLRAAEQIIAGAGMNLAILQFKRGQIPHGEIAELASTWIDQKALGDRTEKTPVAVFSADPAGVIHVRGEGPARARPRSPAITRHHVPVDVMLDLYMPALAQLRHDRIPDRLLVKGGCRLLHESANDAKQIFGFHQVRRWLIRRGRAG
jgi:hypothetical protein